MFVSDFFASDLIGGAELTSQALIDACPYPVHCVHSRDVTLDLLEKGVDKYWIFGNFSLMNLDLIPSIVANMEYSVLEYDYKYCKYRSPEKHMDSESKPCDCSNSMHGKMISTFFYGAKSLWWMSEKQLEKYCTNFPFLEEKDNVVLSSVFDDQFFASVKLLNEKYKDSDRKGWLVLGSTSWVKGTQAAINYCEDNDLDYELLANLPYETVLEKMAQAEGFVYLPAGADTCPRMVIEAKLLGCKLKLNDNVQHSKEIWFETDDPFDTEAYLYAARNRFWSSIKHSMTYIPSVSGYTTTLDCIKNGYPYIQSIQSMIGFCDEVVVVDGGSSDGTWQQLELLASQEKNLYVYQVERDWNHPRFAVFDGQQKAAARSRCTSEYCWQQDADEVVHENDYPKVKQLLRNFPANIDVMCLPVIEFWGGPEKVRLDVTPWKWRLSRNNPDITHGIPKQVRLYDDNGDLYAGLGTDGCDYINADTNDIIPFASFYTKEANAVRQQALSGDKKSLDIYTNWFSKVAEMMPSVYHYSWYDLDRKIKTYKNYWSQHWQSLYNITQEDTSENNMFFNKPWAEVTDEDISALALRLKEEMGGWVFHEKVDFTKSYPHMELQTNQPSLMGNGE
jgi:glycosyltransferase involved in cell wall biosynthesis